MVRIMTSVNSVASLYPLVLLAMCWELVARSGLVPPIFLPAFSHVIAGLWEQFFSGDFTWPVLTSLYRAAIGFAIAMIVGVVVGFAMARWTVVNLLFEPLIAAGFPAPKIALLPIFILWFGIDNVSKILLVAFVCVFPFIVAAHGSAMMVSRAQIWAAEAMNTSHLALFWNVIFPASLPSLMSGIRVAIPHALVATFAAEMIAGGGGLGGELVYAQRFFETTKVFEILLIMLMLGYVMDVAFLRLRSHVLRWHDQNDVTE